MRNGMAVPAKLSKRVLVEEAGPLRTRLLTVIDPGKLLRVTPLIPTALLPAFVTRTVWFEAGRAARDQVRSCQLPLTPPVHELVCPEAEKSTAKQQLSAKQKVLPIKLF